MGWHRASDTVAGRVRQRLATDLQLYRQAEVLRPGFQSLVSSYCTHAGKQVLSQRFCTDTHG